MLVRQFRSLTRLRKALPVDPLSIRRIASQPHPAPAPAPAPTWSEAIADTSAETLTAFHAAVSQNGALFPWGVTLVLSAVSLRLVTLPLVYYNQIHAGRAALASKELPRIHTFVRKSPGNLVQKYLTFRRLRALTFRSAGTSDLHRTRWHLIFHLPLVVSASMGVRAIARTRPDDWTAAGFASFPDLTAADPTGALPLITSALWIWNVDPRTSRPAKQPQQHVQPPQQSQSSPRAVNTDRLIEQLMTRTGEQLTTVLQVVAVASLSFTTDLPAGMLLFWASNGVVTAVQRAVFGNDRIRRSIGLLTQDDLQRMVGPPVLQSTAVAYANIKKELEFVQRELLSGFSDRTVDEKLVKEVNNALERERRRGNISVRLQAVLRKDEDNGRPYVAVVRHGVDANK